MSTYIPYDELTSAFYGGANEGLDHLIATLRSGDDYHALFRMLLLKKRVELGLPLFNPGDLRGEPKHLRTEYKAFVDSTCREIGARCLDAGDIAQAWRYLGSVGEIAPVRAALEKLTLGQTTDEVLKIALDQGVHPQRGFQLTLEHYGFGRAISLFDGGFSQSFKDKQYAAGLLVRAMYKELFTGVCKAIVEKTGELPPERDLAELVRRRSWLFENSGVHATAQHIGDVARIGLLAESREDLIMALCISEYGRLLSPEHHPSPRAPFEDGYHDYARFVRAVLGENPDETVERFRSKMYSYHGGSDRAPIESIILLFWRLSRYGEALDIWQQYLYSDTPERPGTVLPSFYEMCLEAKDYRRLADSARTHDDVAAWAAARMLENTEVPPAQPEATEPAAAAPEASSSVPQAAESPSAAPALPPSIPAAAPPAPPETVSPPPQASSPATPNDTDDLS